MKQVLLISVVPYVGDESFGLPVTTVLDGVNSHAVRCGLRAGMSVDEFVSKADSAINLRNTGACLGARKTGTNIADLIVVFKSKSTV